MIIAYKAGSFKYDKCILATGSTASLPLYTSSKDIGTTRGVFVYHNISDLDAIIEYAMKDEVKHAVVLGGGLLGLEAVYDLET